MAVVAKWMCDRDNTMFDSKKDADAYDKMLELAEQFTALLQREIPGVDDAKAENFGILLAKNKDALVQACKGKVEALETLSQEQDNNVHALAQGQ
ncbi:YebG family protein [Spongiibacter sp. UBA1325]|jgi:dsDNA-binding SOS-regulon protein|uniref:YebG family protein n=1 Tax=Spongiibacter sp. UBA1325 TaxID=1947543 RepID=UPI00257A8D3E|nr:YebG family protein [Spongiibacter sp. UBA1325]|tara:strand:- start:576 stop:860 length:285 start_codon:yes stop_codon:yes gene_type:complete